MIMEKYIILQPGAIQESKIACSRITCKPNHTRIYIQILTMTMNDNEIIFISIETFTYSYIHDKKWKYGKVKKS